VTRRFAENRPGQQFFGFFLDKKQGPDTYFFYVIEPPRTGQIRIKPVTRRSAENRPDQQFFGFFFGQETRA